MIYHKQSWNNYVSWPLHELALLSNYLGDPHDFILRISLKENFQIGIWVKKMK